MCTPSLFAPIMIPPPSISTLLERDNISFRLQGRKLYVVKGGN